MLLKRGDKYVLVQYMHVCNTILTLCNNSRGKRESNLTKCLFVHLVKSTGMGVH